MPAGPKGLTLKQRRFVEEYSTDPNAVQAYYRAFGRHTSKGKRRSYKGAQSAASILLSNPIIQSELSAAQEQWRARVGVDKERVLSELAAVAFADPDDIYEPDEDNGGLPKPRPWRDIPVGSRKSIQSVKVKRKRLKSDDDATAWEVEELEYRFHPKLDALDKLCKRLGLIAPDDGGDASKVVGVPVELAARILALVGARQPQPAGSGGASGGDAVVPQPGPAEPRVPQ